MESRDGDGERVYAGPCGLCAGHSPVLPTLEHIERWQIDHCRTHHPWFLKELREMIVQGISVQRGQEPEWARTWTPEDQARAMWEWGQEREQDAG